MVLNFRYGKLGLSSTLLIALVLGGCAHAGSPTPISNPTAGPSTRPAGTPSPTYSPQQLATRAAFSARVATVDALAATEIALLPACGGSWDWSNSPDGKWKALQCSNNGMGLYDLTDYSKAWYFSYYDLYGLPYENGNHFGYVSPVHWSVDGEFLYFVARIAGDGGCVMYNDGSALFRLDLSSGSYSVVIPPTVGHPYGSFSFSNGDADVAYIGRSPEQSAVLTLLDLHSNSKTDIPLGSRFAEGGNLIWSPDNRQVLFSARSGDQCETMTYYLVMLDLKQRTQKIIWHGKAAEILPVHWDQGDQVIVQVIMQPTIAGGLFSVSLPSGKMKPYSGSAPTATP